MMCVYILYGCGVQRAEEFLKQRVAIGTRVNTRVAQDEARAQGHPPAAIAAAILVMVQVRVIRPSVCDRPIDRSINLLRGGSAALFVLLLVLSFSFFLLAPARWETPPLGGGWGGRRSMNRETRVDVRCPRPC